MPLEFAHRLARLAGFIAILITVGSLATPAFSAEACESRGAPEQRPDSGDESGIGGTGFQDRRPDRSNSQGDDSESGIGGTGIFGTITDRGHHERTNQSTGMDRLCVNGFEIRVPEQVLAQSSYDGPGGNLLSVGMVVWIHAMQDADGLVANQIELHPALAGEVRSVSSSGRELEVAGQRVRLQEETRRGPGLLDESPQLGQWVVVHGLRDEADTLVASRIDLDQESRTLAGDATVADRIADAGRLRVVSIEGYLRGSPGRPRLVGLDLELVPTHPAMDRANLRPGLHIIVEGRIPRAGVFRVDRAKTLERPLRGAPIDRAAPGPPSPPTSDLEAPHHNPIDLKPDRPPTLTPDRPHIERPRDRPTLDRPTSAK
jgi:hypothetical protein